MGHTSGPPVRSPEHAEIVSPRMLRIRGGRTKCLKNISLDLPLGGWISIVGVSGAGKTSLARDTILAEGHRRYLESLSLATRQYLDRFERPDVDLVEGLPPTLALGSESIGRGPRTTLATVLHLQNHLGVIWSQLGEIHCPHCQTILRAETPQSVAQRILSWPAEARVQIAFGLASISTAQAELLARGFTRFVTYSATDNSPPRQSVVIDRVIVPSAGLTGAGRNDEPEWLTRVVEAIELAFSEGGGECHVLVNLAPKGENSRIVQIEGVDWNLVSFSERLRCGFCGVSSLSPEPRMFQFQSPLGACPACLGTGKSGGVKRRSKFASVEPAPDCQECHGERLRPESRNVRVQNTRLPDILQWSTSRIREWLAELQSTIAPGSLPFVSPAIEQVIRRIELLEELGLSDIPWDRATSELSLGERQRLSVAHLLSNRIVHALYLLDEPTRGLHPCDRIQLIQSLKKLQGAGNTLIVVEHDSRFLQAADWVVELGPGSGEQGGEVIFSGPQNEFIGSRGRHFLSTSRSESEPTPKSHSRVPAGFVRLVRQSPASEISFPLGVLCVVTGVSGSGKSRLVTHDLANAVRASLIQRTSEVGKTRETDIDELICMDERPAGLSSYSSPATLLHIWSSIRGLFAATDEARRRQFDVRRFSLSSDQGGRCPGCAGRGFQLVDLQFLPDSPIVCPDCHGRRYRSELLEVTYRALNIAETLDLSIQQALSHFRGENQILRQLTSAVALGLESLRLGQLAGTLSTGELQRLKLAEHLGKRSGRRTLFLLDEPTSGLHPADVQRLVNSLDQLVASGQSVIVIDHHELLLSRSDEIIDLGTSGGKMFGEIASRGSLREVLDHTRSATHAAQQLS